DTVLVQPGTYVENINFNGRNIVLGSLFLTTGDSSHISTTIIDGADSGTVVTFDSGEDRTAVITGFTIKNGQAEYGGGIYCGNGSNPIIVDNIITQNSAGGPGRGGGISCVSSDPLVLNNIIIQNQVFGSEYPDKGLGGGIYCLNSNMEIIGNRICNNIAVVFVYEPYFVTISDGGGIYSESSSPVISGNEIIDNTAGDGGGIYSLYSTPVITSNIISDNSVGGSFNQWLRWGSGGAILCVSSAVDISANRITGNDTDIRGGGISFSNSEGKMSANLLVENSGGGWPDEGGAISLSNSDVDIVNNTLSRNSRGGINCADSSSPRIINTILWADSGEFWQEIYVDSTSTPVITYCDIQDTLWPGVGNISVDPLFRNPDNGDFHLMAPYCGDPYSSPCIDAGDPAILDSLLDCGWGMGWYRSDMGACGGGDSIMVGIDDYVDLLPDQMALTQNYPNPFNTQTTIRFILPEAQNVQLSIYDILGRQIHTLIDEYRQAGRQTVTFDASGLSSGVYFYRLQAGNVVETKRMVLLK
ncbi:MAG: right-handed parallel beta-helix repeat-containing protein, partial [Candidatus Zixiibacteriota bacterium]